MKTHSKLLSSLLFVGLLVGLNSCEKNNSLSIDIPSERGEIYVEGGMLVFKDVETFQKTLTEISNFSRKEYEQWVSNFNGFSSYKQKFFEASDAFERVNSAEDMAAFQRNYKQTIDFLPDSSISEVFASPMVSSFVNMNGHFRVDSSLNILTKHEWILIKQPNETKIQNALSSKISNEQEGIYVTSYSNESAIIINDDQNSLNKIASRNQDHLGSLEFSAVANYDYTTHATADFDDPATAPSSSNKGPGVFSSTTKYSGSNRRLSVSYRQDVYPESNSDGNYRTITLSILAEYKNIFGWHRHQTSQYVDLVYRLKFAPKLLMLMPTFHYDGIYWYQNAKGPFNFLLYADYLNYFPSFKTARSSTIRTDLIAIGYYHPF